MILIVDDDEDVRGTIRDLLSVLSYSSREAESGEAALAIVAESPPEVVILDYMMPGMNGGQVAARLAETHPDLPVIFASGYAEESELRNRLGDTWPILHKPFRLGELAELVGAALARKSA
jgi:two-component system response regulator (stage 0 sporulation protein F)